MKEKVEPKKEVMPLYISIDVVGQWKYYVNKFRPTSILYFFRGTSTLYILLSKKIKNQHYILAKKRTLTYQSIHFFWGKITHFVFRKKKTHFVNQFICHGLIFFSKIPFKMILLCYWKYNLGFNLYRLWMNFFLFFFIKCERNFLHMHWIE